MAQSLCKIYIHLIFHIKTTSPQVRTEDLERLHSYVGQLVNTTGCSVIRVGGTCDHVHMLFMLSRDVTIAHVAEEVKRNSSRWMKSVDQRHYNLFAWQSGYGAFSVSQSVVEKTEQYINGQQEHHKKLSFADEYRNFLRLYNVEYDERYVFRD